MTTLSPEARKAVRGAAARNSLWQPAVKRTSDLVLIERPCRGGGRQFAQLVATQLPQFSFNSKRNRWEAPIKIRNVAAVLSTFSAPVHRDLVYVKAVLSDGIRDYIDESKFNTITELVKWYREE